MAIQFERLEEITRALKVGLQNGKSFHTTFVYRKNKLLVIANNDYEKSHRHHKFSEYKKPEGNYKPCLHSEVAALIRLGRTDCADLTFINIRIDNNGDAAISKPCENCTRLLKCIGYKSLYYHNGEKYVREKF